MLPTQLNDIRIKVNKYRTVNTKDEEYKVFDIEITTPTFTRTLAKRMGQFVSLNTKLEKNYPKVKERPALFHPMNQLSQMLMGQDEVLLERSRKLEKWLCDLQKVPQIFDGFYVQYFLRLYDLSGKVAVVTGANSGIGKITAQHLAEMGCHVFLAARSVEKTLPIVEEIKQSCGHDKVEMLPLDLADFQSIIQCAEEFKKKGLPLHYLINNAGLAVPPSTFTTEGFETTVGVNHIGTLLFTSLLFPLLKLSIPSRIVNVSSIGHLAVDLTQARWGDDIKKPRQGSVDAFDAYKYSKWLMSICSVKMAKKLQNSGISVFHLHPGAVATDVWRSLPSSLQWIIKGVMLTPEEGVLTTLYCTCAKGLEEHSGEYFDDCTIVRSTVTEDEALMERAWKQSLEWCGIDDFL